MNKPTKYKSITSSEIKSRQAIPISNSQKIQAFAIIQKLTDLIKLKHS
jgi:hypothetical protein